GRWPAGGDRADGDGAGNRRLRPGTCESGPAMTTTEAPAPTPAAARRSHAPLPVAATVAAAAAAVVSYVPAVVVVVLLRLTGGGGPGLAGPARLATAGWLLAHGVPVQAGTGVIGVAPLAVTALAAWRLARAGVHVTRAIGARRSGSVRRALAAAAATGIAYGALGLLVTAAAAGP